MGKKRHNDYKRVTNRNYFLANLISTFLVAQPFPTRERPVRGPNNSRIDN
jgi:hypothetical protein